MYHAIRKTKARFYAFNFYKRLKIFINADTQYKKQNGEIPNQYKYNKIAAQTFGPSGGCIPASLIDTPIDNF